MTVWNAIANVFAAYALMVKVIVVIEKERWSSSVVRVRIFAEVLADFARDWAIVFVIAV